MELIYEDSGLISLEERYGAHNYRPLDVVGSQSEGCLGDDVDGKKYLDCLAAYLCVKPGAIVTPLILRRSSTRRKKSR